MYKSLLIASMGLLLSCGDAGTGLKKAFPRASDAQNSTSLKADSSGFGSAGNEVITIRSSPRVAGAIDSLIFGGTEFINSYDHGRQLQTAYILDNGGECYNPTEAGSYTDGMGPNSTSALVAFNTAGSVLTSTVHPAFWLRPGQMQATGICPEAFNRPLVSPDTLEKRIDVGVGGLRQVLKIHTRLSLSTAHSALQIEAATGYQMAAFQQLYAWNEAQNSLTALGGASYDEQTQAAIAATSDGLRAIGAWAPPPRDPAFWLSYGRGYFPGVAASTTSKWTAIYRRGATPAGSYEFDVYVAVGSLDTVRTSLSQIRSQVLGGGVVIPTTLPPTPPAPPPANGGETVAVYRGFNGTNHLFTNNANDFASSGYRSEGVGFLALASAQANGDSRAIYRCLYGAAPFLSIEANCEGQRSLGILGYLPQNAGRRELVRCVRGADHLVTSRDECTAAGYRVEGRLGFETPAPL